MPLPFCGTRSFPLSKHTPIATVCPRETTLSKPGKQVRAIWGLLPRDVEEGNWLEWATYDRQGVDNAGETSPFLGALTHTRGRSAGVFLGIGWVIP